MQKIVYLVHGWEGNPENAWFPWLKKHLTSKDFKVIAIDMPNTETPEIKAWVGKLNDTISNKKEEEIYLVGHSIGCQAIMRYLEHAKFKKPVKKVILVAPFFNLPFLETQEEKDIAEPWLTLPINTKKVKSMAEKFVCIFSDNDPDVSLDESNLFKARLGAKIIIEHNKSHFNDGAGITELPVVLKEILQD